MRYCPQTLQVLGVRSFREYTVRKQAILAYFHNVTLKVAK
jgi:hypothetical protein